MTKVGFVSLGCPKNLVDSEVMMGLLARHGCQLTSAQEEAEVIVVNTCGFIESAKQESIETILEMAQQKVSGRCRKLVVTGCLVERYREEIVREIPEVDAVLGTQQIPEILATCGLVEIPPNYEHRELYLYSDTDPRILTTPPHTAYIKIAEGCDHPCTFCVIPKMRGSFRSRKPDSVVAEAARLARSGVKEINLVGQDTTMYGWDHGDKEGLANLIKELGQVDGIEWIRVLYVYPNNVSDLFLEAVAATPAACNYIDIPLQHASRKVLKNMKRGGNRQSLGSLIRRIRAAIPEVTIRTTMIVGFPGEAESDVEDLLEFIQEARFDRLGVFTYSDEQEAVSNQLGQKVPAELKVERQKRVMELQQAISLEKNRALVGKTLPALLEGMSQESDWLWEGRLPSQAPEIDGVVYLNDGITEETRPGSIVPVRITEAYEHDLVGAALS